MFAEGRGNKRTNEGTICQLVGWQVQKFFSWSVLEFMGLLLLTLSLRLSLKKQGFLENKQTSKKQTQTSLLSWTYMLFKSVSQHTAFQGCSFLVFSTSDALCSSTCWTWRWASSWPHHPLCVLLLPTYLKSLQPVHYLLWEHFHPWVRK